jgi:nitrate reductase beta subunit
MLAMRAYMRAKTVEGRIDPAIAARVGLSQAAIEDMYKTMALAAYEDRYVIPTTHREVDEDAYQMRGSAGFGFREGSNGASETNLFGGRKRAPRRKYMDIPT